MPVGVAGAVVADVAAEWPVVAAVVAVVAADVLVESPGARARMLLPGPPDAVAESTTVAVVLDVDEVDDVLVDVGVTLHGYGTREHGPEAQLGGLAHQVAGLVAILHAGQVDHDLVAVALDLGLGHAETVHPVADDVHGLVDHGGRTLLAHLLEAHLDAALEVEAEDRARPADERERRTSRR